MKIVLIMIVGLAVNSSYAFAKELSIQLAMESADSRLLVDSMKENGFVLKSVEDAYAPAEPNCPCLAANMQFVNAKKETKTFRLTWNTMKLSAGPAVTEQNPK